MNTENLPIRGLRQIHSKKEVVILELIKRLKSTREEKSETCLVSSNCHRTIILMSTSASSINKKI